MIIIINLKTAFVAPNIYPLYESNMQKKRDENIASVMTDPGLKRKAKNWAEKWGWNEKDVLDKIRDDKMFAQCFAKDPSKQSIHQSTAHEFLSALPFISHFETLPTTNPEKTLFCKDGKVIKRKDLIDPNATKSIDFHWEYIFKDKKIDFYASHKYTKEGGGAQDNQFNDVIAYNKEAMKCTGGDIYFLSIVDGPYYNTAYKKDISFTGTKLTYLEDKLSGPRNKSTTSNELLKTIIPIIMRWLNENFEPEEYSEELQRLRHVFKAYK